MGASWHCGVFRHKSGKGDGWRAARSTEGFRSQGGGGWGTGHLLRQETGGGDRGENFFQKEWSIFDLGGSLGSDG